VSHRRILSVALLACASTALLEPPAAGQAPQARKYIAFGDSITFGFGDNRSQPGYPPQLETILVSRGLPADVINEGLAGETTAEALSRINSVLNRANAGDVLLLMEGTNDINARISNETIVENLNVMANRAEVRSIEAVHATVIPRLPGNGADSRNLVTASLAGLIRELAWVEERRLADPFEVILRQAPDFSSLYLGGADKLHPNQEGYDLIAEVFADVLTNVDSVPPVTGRVEPGNDAQNVAPTAPVRIDLYDFGAGIDLAATRVLINDQEVATPITGSPRKIEIRYEAPQPWVGVVRVGLRTRDTAATPHTVDREVTQFVIAGTSFLAGDIDRDGRVDGRDLIILALSFGSRDGEIRFRGVADLNGDGIVDGADLAELAANFGRQSF